MKSLIFSLTLAGFSTFSLTLAVCLHLKKKLLFIFFLSLAVKSHRLLLLIGFNQGPYFVLGFYTAHQARGHMASHFARYRHEPIKDTTSQRARYPDLPFQKCIALKSGGWLSQVYVCSSRPYVVRRNMNLQNYERVNRVRSKMLGSNDCVTRAETATLPNETQRSSQV